MRKVNTNITGGNDSDGEQAQQKQNMLATDETFNSTPPSTMVAGAKKIWKEILKAYPDKSLSNTDRLGLEIMSNLMFEYRTSPSDMSSQKLSQLIRLVNEFGGSLKSKASLNTVAPPEEDYSAYLNLFKDE